MIRRVSFLLILTGFALSACAGPQKQAAVTNPLLPLPEELTVIDPGNDLFMVSLENYVRQKNAPANTQYEFTRLDLDGDGRREGIAIMKTPHSYWCNNNGCAMAVFRAANEGFSLSSEVSSVRGPIIVSEARSNGWRDLVVRVSGRTGWNAKDVALRFDGQHYPPQPAFQPQLEIASAVISGVRIFP